MKDFDEVFENKENWERSIDLRILNEEMEKVKADYHKKVKVLNSNIETLFKDLTDIGEVVTSKEAGFGLAPDIKTFIHNKKRKDNRKNRETSFRSDFMSVKFVRQRMNIYSYIYKFIQRRDEFNIFDMGYHSIVDENGDVFIESDLVIPDKKAQVIFRKMFSLPYLPIDTEFDTEYDMGSDAGMSDYRAELFSYQEFVESTSHTLKDLKYRANIDLLNEEYPSSMEYAKEALKIIESEIKVFSQITEDDFNELTPKLYQDSLYYISLIEDVTIAK